MSVSFEEKSAWVTLISLLIVSAVYTALAASMMSAGVTVLAAYVPLFAVVVVLLVLVLAVGHAAVAIASRPDGRDERDQLIEWRAESNAGWVLGAGVLAALGGLILALDSVWIAHTLIMSLVASEVVKSAAQLFYYRRGLQ